MQPRLSDRLAVWPRLGPLPSLASASLGPAGTPRPPPSPAATWRGAEGLVSGWRGHGRAQALPSSHPRCPRLWEAESGWGEGQSPGGPGRACGQPSHVDWECWNRHLVALTVEGRWGQLRARPAEARPPPPLPGRQPLLPGVLYNPRLAPRPASGGLLTARACSGLQSVGSPGSFAEEMVLCVGFEGCVGVVECWEVVLLGREQGAGWTYSREVWPQPWVQGLPWKVSGVCSDGV